MPFSSKIYIIEDLLFHQKIISEALNDIITQYSQMKIMPVANYLAFYNEIDSLVIYDTDIFIIDIDLKTFHTGIDYAKKIREKNKKCFIIFLTADDKKGIEIINLNIHATTYLVKGNFEPLALKNNLQIELNKIQKITQNFYMAEDDHYIQIQVENTIFNTKVADILYIETIKTMKHYLLLKTTTQELILRGTISDMKKDLVKIDYIFTGFKSLIINLNAISFIDKSEGKITFLNGDYIFGGRKIIEKLAKSLK